MVNNFGGGDRPWVLGAPIYKVREMAKISFSVGFSFFQLSFHHPNNRLENSPIFLFVPLQLIRKKLFLDKKKRIGVALTSMPSPHARKYSFLSYSVIKPSL
jgi:hypothetical protein